VEDTVELVSGCCVDSVTAAGVGADDAMVNGHGSWSINNPAADDVVVKSWHVSRQINATCTSIK